MVGSVPLDIFSWLDETLTELDEHDPQLAHDLVRLSGWACNGEPARVDAALPRIVARARQLDLPWVEVYARHWGLQSSVARHYRVREGLPEAVALLERAHRPDARDCPQSVCVTQDLCIAYALTDGPGYAAERERASRDTLERIDESWPCWRCINSELADALRDQGRAEDALAIYEGSAMDIRLADFGYVDTLSELGRHDEAADLVPQLRLDLGRLGELGQSVKAALYLARAGRQEEAAAALPSFTATLADACEYHEDYVEALVRLIDHGAIEASAEYTRQITGIAKTLRDRGAIRPGVRVVLTWVESLLRRDPDPSVGLAEAFLELIEPMVAQLRGSFGDVERFETMRAQIRATVVQPLAHDPEGVKARLEEGPAPTFDQLQATARAVPAATDVVVFVAEHWARRGWPERSDAYYDLALNATPDALSAWVSYMVHLVRQNAWDRVEAALDRVQTTAEGELALHRRWFEARLHEARSRPDDARACYEALIDEDAAWCGDAVFQRLAALQTSAGDLLGALRTWSVAIAERPDFTDARWDRMTVCAQLGRWDLIRSDAAVLEIDVPEGTGPIDEAYGSVRLVVADRDRPLWARRTSPVTARVRQILTPETPERFGELWAFDAAPVSRDEDGTCHFRAVAQIEDSDWVAFTIDGAPLLEHHLDALREVVAAQGGELFLYSNDAYRIQGPDRDADEPAEYRKVAVPRDRFDGAAFVACLESIGAEVRPLVWLELCELLGDADARQTQLAVARDWGME